MPGVENELGDELTKGHLEEACTLRLLASPLPTPHECCALVLPWPLAP